MAGNYGTFDLLGLTDSSIPRGARQKNFFANSYKRKVAAL